jgi:hypothetical protein
MKLKPILSIIVVFSFISIGCKSKKETFTTDSLKVPDSISLKGLSLGMEFSKARELVLKLFEDAGFSKEIVPNINADNTEICVIKNEDRPICISIWKDKNNFLRKVEMSTYATDIFFSAKDLGAEEFVKEFAKNYGLPEIKPAIDKSVGYTYWNYDSKNGWQIRINDAKYIIFEIILEKQKKAS